MYRHSWDSYKVQRVHRACHSLQCESGGWLGGVFSALTADDVVICSSAGHSTAWARWVIPSSSYTVLAGTKRKASSRALLHPARGMSLSTFARSRASSQWLLELSDDCSCLPLELAFSRFIAGHADSWRHVYHDVCCCLIEAPSRDIRSPRFCSWF